MMREYGLTGGIGSGKSTVARSLEALGYRVYYADDRAKMLYDTDPTLKMAIKALCGADVYDAQDLLDRKLLSARIFGDKSLLAQVNALVHPAVARDYAAWVAACPADYRKTAVIKEAAILFEAGSQANLAGVIMVYAPKSIRLQRVQARDTAAQDQVMARMNNQWPDSRKVALSQFIIYNDGHHALLPQVQRAIQWMEAK